MHLRINCIGNLPLRSSRKILKFILKFVRFLYFGGAIYFVCFGYYETMLKAKEENRHVKEEVKVFSKHRYPSLTFCYVYKDGGKYVWKLYLRHLIENWKHSGNWCRVDTCSFIRMILILYIFNCCLCCVKLTQF